MFELATFINLCDQVVKLFDYRNKRTKAYFEQVVKPCYESAKIARDDLVSIYNTIEQAINDGATPKEIEGKMLALRGAHLGTRDALRGILRHIPEHQLTDFERAIISLLGGGHTHALMRLHLDIRHVSEAICRLQKEGGNSDRIEGLRVQLLRSVKRAREIAEAAWRDIVDGYGSYVCLYVQNPA